ncbi:MAG: alpha/beta hydrolase [Rubrivivax sp.]
MPTHDDPAWLEAQYDNRARVPDALRRLAAWAEASQAARAACPLAQRGLRYAPGSGGLLDVFPAAPGSAGSGAAPVLFFVHGGYWRALGKDDFSFLAPVFNAAGATVVVPDYALCPQVSIEHIALQMTQALAWTVRHAASFGADPGRILVAGHSAGGHLAAMLLACRWREVDPALPAQPLAGALAISGVYDLEPIRLVPSLQKDLALTPASVRRLSPAFFPRPRQGRLHAVAGAQESEEFLRQNQLIRDAWGPTTVPVCEALPGLNHFTVMTALADPAHWLHQMALAMLGLR